MVEILTMATVITPITGGLVHAVKKATQVNKRYLPVIAIGIGLTLGTAAYFLNADLGLRLWAGGVSGLASVGLFELGKNVRGYE